jgi:hypothetical protein
MYLHGMYMPQYITEEGPGTREILIGVLGRALSYTYHMYNIKANGRDTDIIPLTPFLAEPNTLMDKPDIRTILLPGCPSISRRGWIFLGKTNEELKQIVDSMFEEAFKEVVERKLQHRQPGFSLLNSKYARQFYQNKYNPQSMLGCIRTFRASSSSHG